MAILSLMELFDVIIMSLCIGYIFHSYFAKFNIFRKPRDYVQMYHHGKSFIWSDIWFSIALVAPAIVLHELGHKLVALSFGLSAEFHAAYFWLIFGMGLKLLNFPFLFFVPAYVSILGNATPIQNTIIAFAGPGINLVLWIGSALLSKANIDRKYVPFLVITKKLNMFLFIFNMIPIPGFDGSKVLGGLWNILFH